ncbi:lactamase [bacterium]|nr:lactamase [Chloroflexi bacterium CFX6]RIL10762.1 MAG: lactamase [bacterium]
MDIIWHGRGCVELRAGGAVVVTDPPAAIGGTRLASLKADIATLSAPPAPAGADLPVGGTPFVVTGPGEYEARGIFLIGVDTAVADTTGADAPRNTAYCIDLDDVTVCHLGRLGHRLTQSQVDALGVVHVLLVPIGHGGDALAPADALEVVNQIEPSIVVPLYDPAEPPGGGGPMDRFVLELGGVAIEPRAMLKVDAARLPEEPQVVVLDPVA